MRKFVTGALALALMASAGAAAAQEHRDNPQVRRSWKNPPPGYAPQAPQAPRAPEAQRPPAAPEAGVAHRDDGDRRWRDDRRGDREGRRDWDGRDRREGDGRWRDGDERRRWEDRRRWDDDRRHQPRPRYDRRRYDPVWRHHQRYRGWAYHPPAGFYARRWTYGDVLPRGWWGPDYRILDWWSYGLPIPPAGYEWVRVGDHAVLVDLFSGRVVQVAYDLFW